MLKKNDKKQSQKVSNKLVSNKSFWVITIYIIFLIIDHFALDSKTGVIWDNLKSRWLKIKKLIMK
ncbi:MAG: hypothetical protein ACK5JH_07515 [Anaerocolumna sp.]